MKTKRYVLIFLFILCAPLLDSIEAQCGKKLIDKCLTSIDPYHYQRQFAFEIYGSKGSVDYSITLSRGVRYKFEIAGSKRNEADVIVEIRHRTKNNLIATNYDAQSDKCYSSIEFENQTTGSVVVSFFFKGRKDGCGACVMGISTN